MVFFFTYICFKLLFRYNEQANREKENGNAPKKVRNERNTRYPLQTETIFFHRFIKKCT